MKSLNDSQFTHPVHEPKGVGTARCAVTARKARGIVRMRSPGRRFMESIRSSFRRLHWNHEPKCSSVVTNRLTAILPLPAGEGRGEGESFERECRRFIERAFIRNLIPVLVIFALALLAAGCLSRPALVRQDFVLQTVPAARPAASPVAGVLTLTSCDVSPPFASQALVYQVGTNAFETDPYAGFLVPPDKTLAIAIRTWLAHSGLFTNVLAPGSSVPSDQSLEVYVDELYGDLQVPGRPQAVLSLSLVLFDTKKGNGKQVLFQKEYSRHKPVNENTAAAIVAGWNQALGEILGDFAADLDDLKKNP